MPYRHTWEPQGVHLQVFGVASGKEVDAANQLIRSSPDLLRFNYVIADFLEVEVLEVSHYEVLLIAARDHWSSRVNPQLKIALVGDRATVRQALDVYAGSAVIKDYFRVRLFESLPEARSWVAEH